MANPRSEVLEWVMCRCPKCETYHKKKMHWSGGKYVPRMFCYECANNILDNDRYIQWYNTSNVCKGECR